VRTVPASTFRIAARFGGLAIGRFVNEYVDAIELQSERTVRSVIESRLLGPTEVDRLFELYVGFEIVDGLTDLGYSATRLRLIPGKDAPFATMELGGGRLELWWQRPIWIFYPALSEESEYRRTLVEVGLSSSSLRPDFVLLDSDRERIVAIEVKYSAVDEHSADRRGIQDALLYLSDANAVFEDKPLPHALVASWNTSATLQAGRVLVCSRETVRMAVTQIVNSWTSTH
jgi:hypothetical protein